MQFANRYLGAASIALAVCAALGDPTVALAQFPRLKFPAPKSNPKNKPAKNDDGGATPPGVPISMDSPVIASFQNLEKQKIYHYRMVMPDMDPQMVQMMAQYGISPYEITVAGDTRMTVMHMKMPALDIPGQIDDWEIRGVVRNGRAAKLITSPAAPRILAASDARFAKQMEEMNRAAAQSIARSMASGPVGWAGAAATAAATAAADVLIPQMQKKAHEFFQWQCLDVNAPVIDKTAPPPVTDVKAVGDMDVDGVHVTQYEFYVHENGKFNGPLKMYVVKESQLPMRIDMTDRRMPGTMRMEYFGYGEGGEIETPACLDKK